MPSAATVTRGNVTVNSVTVAKRLDEPATATAPLAGRFWVRVVNPDPTYRLYIGYDSGTVDGTSWETADPFNGVWEGPVAAGVALYAVMETGAVSISARVIQMA